MRQAGFSTRCCANFKYAVCRWGSPDTSRAPANKHLAIALNNGLLQLMASQLDQQPVIVDTMVRVACIAWNAHGTVLGGGGGGEKEEDKQKEKSNRLDMLLL
jgi:hypothetical protein